MPDLSAVQPVAPDDEPRAYVVVDGMMEGQGTELGQDVGERPFRCTVEQAGEDGADIVLCCRSEHMDEFVGQRREEPFDRKLLQCRWMAGIHGCQDFDSATAKGLRCIFRTEGKDCIDREEIGRSAFLKVSM